MANATGKYGLTNAMGRYNLMTNQSTYKTKIRGSLFTRFQVS